MEKISELELPPLSSLHGNKKIALDYRLTKNNHPKPVIMFVHGFKGFKDWGHFNLVAEEFAQNGFAFVKLNLSHNGTTLEEPRELVDFEAFSQNNFSIELDDIGVCIDQLFKGQLLPAEEIDLNRFFLVGHSRGGSLALLKTAEDNRVKGVATWGAVSNFEARWSKKVIDAWKVNGIHYVEHKRTGAKLPLHYQLVENYLANIDRLHIESAVKSMSQPLFVIHGSNDESVPVDMAHELKSFKPGVELEIIDGAGHTFGGVHPYLPAVLPDHSRTMIKKTIEFFNAIP